MYSYWPKFPLILSIWLVILFTVGCSFSTPKIPVKGKLIGESITTTVDSEIAKYYLENYLQNNRTNSEFDRKIDQVYQQYGFSLPNREELKKMSQSFSVDFAALFFAGQLWRMDANRKIQNAFREKMAETKVSLQNGRAHPIPDSSSYLTLFVPGWGYQENGHITGADFAMPRKLISSLGIENHLVEIPSMGSVEENAEFLRKEIVRYSKSQKKIIIAGASSAGPAIHLVLGKLLHPEQLKHVKAWVNFGGILQGSPLVDYLQEWPKSWIFQLVLWYEGWEKESFLSMSAKRSRERFKMLSVPKHIVVINYLGISLSGEISQYSHDKYPILRKEGPNDGLTLLTDIVAPDSMTIIAVRSDHFFAEDPEINLKTVALTKAIISHLEISPKNSHKPRVE